MSLDEIEKHYSNEDLTVVWRPSRCMHSKRCWRELPSVFDPGKRPWVTIGGATSAEIAAQVRRCPSGALSLLGEDVSPTSAPVAQGVRSPRDLPSRARTSRGVGDVLTVTRELLIHRLHEAAELEHSAMCAYLYAAFSLRQGSAEGLTPGEEEATARWRRAIIDVAVEEMGHLAAVWNITSALGGSPRFGRANFPTEPGLLPASVVMKLSPFSEATIQHFIYLERPLDSQEPEGIGFAPALSFVRGATRDGLTPMSVDYETVGRLYTTIEDNLRAFADAHGEEIAFPGDSALQLSQDEAGLDCLAPVTNLESALVALRTIVEQGEGAPDQSENSHFVRFAKVREELLALRTLNPAFEPAFPAAVNPVLRRPPAPTGRVWIQHEDAAKTVDIANASYALMLRLLAYSYVLPRTSFEKRIAVGLSIELMRAVTLLGERSARLPSGPSTPDSNAGMSFTTLRDSAALQPGTAARFYFIERFEEIAGAAADLDMNDPRAAAASRITASLAMRATKSFSEFP